MSSPLFESKGDVDSFARKIGTRALGRALVFHSRVSSTNDLALDTAKKGGAHGLVFVADVQDSGRGRRGRRWEAPPAKALLFSVLIRPVPAHTAGWIPLAAGLACVEAIRAVAAKIQGVTLKWPNDIVLPFDTAPGWKKLGGILCESALPALAGSVNNGASGYAVIGVGLNVNQSAAILPQTDKAPPTSLLIEGGETFDRKILLQRILERLEASLDMLSEDARRAELRASIEKLMRAWLPPSKKLIFHAPSQGSQNLVPRSGTFAGLDESGCLRVCEQNQHRAFADAEIVSVE